MIHRRYAVAVVLEICETASWGLSAQCAFERESRWRLPGETWHSVPPVEVRAVFEFMKYLAQKYGEGNDVFSKEKRYQLVLAVNKFLRGAMSAVNVKLKPRVDKALMELFSRSRNDGFWSPEILELRDEVAMHHLINLKMIDVLSF